MSEEINHGRRRSLATASMTIAATQLGVIGSAALQSSKEKLAVRGQLSRGRTHLTRMLI